MRRLFVVENQGRLRDAYNASPSWFDRSVILAVCVDSQRDLRRILPFTARIGLDGQIRNCHILFGPGSAQQVFASKGFLCGFDALYLFDEVPAPSVSPIFDRTTEWDDLLDPSGQFDLAADLVKTGAAGYVADGCGLFCCTLDPGIARELESKLQDSRTRTVTI